MSAAKHTPTKYGPNNPPRLRMPGESVEDYRVAMGWDQPRSAQHTAGKWYACEWTCHAATTVVVDDPTANVTGKRIVAECETEDDARLIAAAPELFAELQRVYGAFGGETFDWAPVRAAIAKAGGEA